jgi:hypothetical protein
MQISMKLWSYQADGNQDLLQSQGLNLASHFLSGAINFDPVVTVVDAKLASQIVWLDLSLMSIERLGIPICLSGTKVMAY